MYGVKLYYIYQYIPGSGVRFTSSIKILVRSLFTQGVMALTEMYYITLPESRSFSHSVTVEDPEFGQGGGEVWLGLFC